MLSHRTGDGLARYAAARFDDPSLRKVLAGALAEAGCGAAAPGAGDGVEVVRRTAGADAWVFVLNHTQAAVRVALTGWDLVAARAVEGELVLAAGGAAVVREAPGRG